MIDATDFGVRPVADSTAGLRDAIAASKGAPVMLPAGRIELSEPIEVTDAPVHLVGGGPWVTTMVGSVVARRSSGYDGSGPIFRDLRIEGDGSGDGLVLDGIVHPRLDNDADARGAPCSSHGLWRYRARGRQ